MDDLRIRRAKTRGGIVTMQTSAEAVLVGKRRFMAGKLLGYAL